ncbi:hypothetical protein [Silvanigrella sp.]|jgi:hypothetical protein|uniref:hypothetical protein n=1 Tax=Silvanigrella sp. TaxID=2024976 RepID=UPI0037C9A5A8
MNFENFLSQKIFELRHELNKLTNEHPELKPHFGLSHAGLLDNETEKLVESCSFFLRLTHSKMQSVIANQVRNFMEPIFPEWYMPEIPSYIIEFDNFEEFYSIQEEFDENEIISCECTYENKNLKLSAPGGMQLSPFSAMNSFFVTGDRECYLHIKFENRIEFEDYDFNAKIRLYLHSDDSEEIVSLISYLFDKNLIHKQIILQSNEEEYKADKTILSLNFENSEKKNVFFESKNKLENTREILNNLKNLLFIDIDLTEFKTVLLDDFTIKIPLLSQAFLKFKHLKNFIKTNCFIFYNIYKTKMPWQFIDIDSKDELEIASLKHDGVIHICKVEYYDNKRGKEVDLKGVAGISKFLSFDFEIPFNIEYKIKINKELLKDEIHIYKEAICTTLIKNPCCLLEKEIFTSKSSNNYIGKILNSNSNHIFYSEALSDPKFFQYLYNMNYFIGKKIKPLKFLINYYNKIEHLYFNHKMSFYFYLKNILEQNWNLKVEMINENLEFYSDFLLTAEQNKSFFFYDRYMEFIMTQMNDKDYKHIIRRN